jgi:uncharacterized membrane protein
MNTNANALYALAWLVVGVWSLVRLVQLGSGTLPAKVQATPLLTKIPGGLGMVLTMFAFFSNLLVLVALLTLIEKPPAEVADILSQAKTLFLSAGQVLAMLPLPLPTELWNTPHHTALALVAGLLLTGEALMLPAGLAFSTVVMRRQERALADLETRIKQGKNAEHAELKRKADGLPNRPGTS